MSLHDCPECGHRFESDGIINLNVPQEKHETEFSSVPYPQRTWVNSVHVVRRHIFRRGWPFKGMVRDHRYLGNHTFVHAFNFDGDKVGSTTNHEPKIPPGLASLIRDELGVDVETYRMDASEVDS